MNERIKELRKFLGLTLEKFGNRLGVTKVTISRLENGINSVTEQMFRSICREFDVSEKWLRTGEGDMFIIPEDDTAALVSNLLEEPDDEFYQSILELVRTYEQLSPESRKVIREFGNMYLNNMKNRKA